MLTLFSAFVSSGTHGVENNALWEQIVRGRIQQIAISPDRQYLLSNTEISVALLNASGNLLWEKEHTAISQWYRSYAPVTVAVAPNGRRLAVAGTEGYRCVWELDRSGRKRWFIKTIGTPEAMAFSHKGDLLAIATAKGHIYFVDNSGKVLMEIQYGGVPRKLKFSEDDEYLLTTETMGSAVLLTRTGEIVWQQHGAYMKILTNSMFTWFLISETPMHGPIWINQTLLSRKGNFLWSEYFIEDGPQPNHQSQTESVIHIDISYDAHGFTADSDTIDCYAPSNSFVMGVQVGWLHLTLAKEPQVQLMCNDKLLRVYTLR